MTVDPSYALHSGQEFFRLNLDVIVQAISEQIDLYLLLCMTLYPSMYILYLCQDSSPTVVVVVVVVVVFPGKDTCPAFLSKSTSD